MRNSEKLLIAFFKESGADERQSITLARQIIRRAGQLSLERGWTEVQATEYLLKLFLEARRGE